MATSLPPLPQGYKLEESGGQKGIPAPPSGYKLTDSGPQPSQPAKLPERAGFLQQVVTGLSTIPMDSMRGASVIPRLFAHPLDTAKSLYDAQAEQFRLGSQPNVPWYERAGRYAAGALPLLGPVAASAGEDIGSGLATGGTELGRGIARSAELLGPEAAKALPREVPVMTRTVRPALNPLENRALGSVEGEVRMTPGQRSGQVGLQKAEKALENLPATQHQAGEFYRGQQEDLAAAGRSRVAQQPGARGGPVEAGQQAQQLLEKRVQDLRKQGSDLYEKTKAATKANVQRVQTGTQQVPGSNPAATLTPAGMPRTVPVYADLETPVDLGPMRVNLQPIYEDLMRYMPEARRQYNPAFRALDEFMRSGDQHAQAMDFDKFLGSLKRITRDGSSEFLTSASQGLAKQMIARGESQMQAALANAGPDTAKDLAAARKTWSEMHDTADFLDSLRSEPAQLYRQMVSRGDSNVNALHELRRTAPDAANTVGRTFLEEMMDKATREGGWSRSAGVKADWDGLGPQTKTLLFGGDLARRMDDFLLAAKKLTPHEGSPTAGRLAAIASYGDVGLAVSEFLAGSAAGHPAAGAAAAAGTLWKTRFQPKILARLAFDPKGPTLLKDVITVPVNSPAFNQTMRALSALGAEQQDQ